MYGTVVEQFPIPVGKELKSSSGHNQPQPNAAIRLARDGGGVLKMRIPTQFRVAL